MSNTLSNPLVANTLSQLHRQAKGDWKHFIGIAPGYLLTRLTGHDFMSAKTPVTAFMAVSREEGEFLHFLARAIGAKQIVEFGCSFGISTIYLASAARDSGGHVITTEIEPSKCIATDENLKKAGLDDLVTILEGDALQTLTSVKGSIDLLFLDGAKPLYVPVLQLLRPQLRPGAIVIGDNADMPQTQVYVEYVCQKDSGFTSARLFNGRALVSSLNG